MKLDRKFPLNPQFEIIPEFIDQFIEAAYKAGQVNTARLWMDLRERVVKEAKGGGEPADKGKRRGQRS